MFFHIGLPKTGTTTLQRLVRMDERINVVHTRFFNRYEYWEKEMPVFPEEKTTLVTEENQILQTADFGKFILLLSRIREYSPHAHILISIREQRDMMESRYKYQFNWHGGYTKGFADWLRSGQGMDYLSICMFDTVYEAIRAFFPDKQIHFLLFEELKNDFSAFFKEFYGLLGMTPPLELIEKPQVYNRAMAEQQLLWIKRLNRLKISRSDSVFSKYEFALYRKVSAYLTKDKSKCDEFRWDYIPGRERIEEDFKRENNRLVERGLFSRERLLKYNYLLS